MFLPSLEQDVMRRAEKIQADLAHEFPSMIVSMKPSHVTRGFLLEFCQKHRPKEDTMFVLEDESKQSFDTKYVVRSRAMSAGWIRFAKTHELKEGDAVVFHLVNPTRFKIVLMKKRGKDLGFELKDAIRLPKFDRIDFEQVKSWEDFDIIVDGLVLNPELSKSLQLKYYELCSSQKSFLHYHLLEALNGKLVAGVIAETIKLADGIRDPKLATCQDNFPTWEKILRSFQGLGMNVGFLRAMLDQLMNISAISKRNEKAGLERSRGEELKLSETEETATGQVAEIGTSNVDTEDLEMMFQEMAKAPWLMFVEQGDGAN